jgi:hypothetical protein
MKAYKDKTTGLWKWGTRGEAIYNSKEEASRKGMDLLTERLRVLRDKLNNTIANHGR